MRRLRSRQQRLSALREQACRAGSPPETDAAWVKLRSGYLGRTDEESRTLGVTQEQLRIAIAVRTRRLRRSSGRRRAIQNLLAAAETAEQKREESLHQAEADQRAGVSRRGEMNTDER